MGVSHPKYELTGIVKKKKEKKKKEK